MPRLCALLVLLVTFSLTVGTADAARSPIHGAVVSVDASHDQVLLRHDPFPGMPMAMTMMFRLKNPADLKKLRRGSVIDATVDTSTEPWVLSNVRVKATGRQTKR